MSIVIRCHAAFHNSLRPTSTKTLCKHYLSIVASFLDSKINRPFSSKKLKLGDLLFLRYSQAKRKSLMRRQNIWLTPTVGSFFLRNLLVISRQDNAIHSCNSRAKFLLIKSLTSSFMSHWWFLLKKHWEMLSNLTIFLSLRRRYLACSGQTHSIWLRGVCTRRLVLSSTHSCKTCRVSQLIRSYISDCWWGHVSQKNPLDILSTVQSQK